MFGSSLGYFNLKYTSTFKVTGAIYNESIILLRELKKKDWSSVKESVYRDNLLKKKSTSWIEHVLQAFDNRYLKNKSSLPAGKYLSRFVSLFDSKQVIIPVLFQYICASYPLIDKLVTNLVGEALAEYPVFRLTESIYDEFWKKESERHPEIKRWSERTQNKYRGDFKTFLRVSGLMEKAPSLTVKKAFIKPETFSFHLYHLIRRDLSYSTIFNNKIWRRFFLSQGEVKDLLGQCQVRGWLDYRGMGDIIELIPKFRSLEEWLDSLEKR